MGVVWDKNKTSFTNSLAGVGKRIRQGTGDALLNLADKVAPGLKNLVKEPMGPGTKPASAIRASVSTTPNDWRCQLTWRGVLDLVNKDNPGPFLALPKVGNDVTIVWPYTPQFSINYQASYEMVKTIQTNYATPAYQSSDLSNVIINGEFTATTGAEACYLYAVIHFLKSATKGFGWENTDRTGLPPPVLTLKYLGDGGVNTMPVVVQNFNIEYPKDVDYIKTNFLGLVNSTSFSESMVPAEMNINVTLMPAYSRAKMKDANFSTTKFISGELISKGYF